MKNCLCGRKSIQDFRKKPVTVQLYFQLVNNSQCRKRQNSPTSFIICKELKHCNLGRIYKLLQVFKMSAFPFHGDSRGTDMIQVLSSSAFCCEALVGQIKGIIACKYLNSSLVSCSQPIEQMQNAN